MNTNPVLFEPTYLNIEYFFDKILYFLQNPSLPFMTNIGQTINVLLSILAMFFIGVIIYTSIRMFEIREREHEHLHHEIAEYAKRHAEIERERKENGGGYKDKRWAKVLEYVFSNNEGDWKLAIIEADTMLEDLLTELGFRGENIGEKLKSADRESFRNLNSAWEAHTIRNRIAHEGSTFTLSSHEAKRVVTIYEQIFREYGFI